MVRPVAVTAGLIAACGGSDSSTDTTTTTTTQPSVQPANFSSAALKSAITTVSYTLPGGTTTTCYQIVTTGAPSEHAVGPFCPANISDGSVAGMWIESGKTYDLTGTFIADLATSTTTASGSSTTRPRARSTSRIRSKPSRPQRRSRSLGLKLVNDGCPSAILQRLTDIDCLALPAVRPATCPIGLEVQRAVDRAGEM